ncbi:MAG: hypothetical protein II875_02660 [Clostridia bacterium]|nr:hypothetical protein [Clostridia bacterium]
MAELEKVIKGLECCMSERICKGCPYKEKDECEDGGYYYSKAIEDALELLKEREARVVTTADFENNPNLDDRNHLNVWEEYRDGTRCGWDTINMNDVSTFTDLRRYWTSRPTEEQRKAVKWE